MPKNKIPRKSTLIDMTAMCDVSFLLLTFFMLATKFRPPEPVQVVTPTSISEYKLPESDKILITVDKDSRIFFEMDGQEYRANLIDLINSQMNLGLNDEEKRSFILGAAVGVPFTELKSFLALPPDKQKGFKQPGIPADTSLTDKNELFKWVANARVSNQKAKLIVKGDSKAPYPVIDKIFKTLANDKVNAYNFNLLTGLEMDPNKLKAAKEMK